MDEAQLWMKMPIEQMQNMEKRYKAKNGIEAQAIKEQELKKKKAEQMQASVWNGMKEVVPYLDQ